MDENERGLLFVSQHGVGPHDYVNFLVYLISDIPSKKGANSHNNRLPMGDRYNSPRGAY